MKPQLNTYVLRIELARANMKPVQLAEKVGISRQRLHWMVKNKNASNQAVINRIAKVLGVSMGDLIQ